MTMKEELVEKLKQKWMSNYMMAQEMKSASAGSLARKIRQCPPEGYTMIQRPKDVPAGYHKCLEFRLVKLGQQRLFDETY
mgnify:CR=1 FL=1